jgi:alpha-galactosidase
MSPHFRRFVSIGLSLAAMLRAATSLALTNNVALTPPMGWNSWNYFGCNISDATVRGMAASMATNGMWAAGYQFVNMDDCWQVSRNGAGVIMADPVRFPYGIAALAAFVHSKGLNLGLYSDHGLETCQGRPGGYEHEYLDANTYSSWGVDYLKYDNCNLPAGDVAQNDYLRMADALMNSGRPITFSICAWSFGSWMPGTGNLWRTTGDINDEYATMISHLDPNSTTAFVAGPGRWNDPDMLEVGNGGMTATQDQTHFTLWCIMAAPLIMGNNLTNMSAQALATLTNAEAIAVDQDPAGEEGVKVVNNAGSVGTNEVWSRTLGYDFSTKAVVLLNRFGPPTNITVYWTNLGLQAGPATVRDLWAHVNLGTFTNSFTTNVASNAAVMLKVAGTPPVLPGLGTNYLTGLAPVYAYTGWGTMVNNQSIGGNPITLNGVTYTNGIGVNCFAGSDYSLGGICSRFQATIGVDDEVGDLGTVDFQVYADGLQIYESGLMVGGGPSQTIDLDVTGVRRLILGVGDAGVNINYGHADWAGALVIVTNTSPQLPYAPAGLAASPGNSVTLTWNSTLAANTYNVKRAPNSGGPYTTLTNVPITTFTDAHVTLGTAYYYVVSSVNITGEGANSLEVSATPCGLPAVPVNVATTAGTSVVFVQWNASAGASSYNVERFTAGTPPALLATGVTETNFTDTTVADGETNYYLVAAVNDCNQSDYSAFAAAVVPFPPPPAVYWTNAVTTAAQSWNVNANWTNSAAFPNSSNVLAVISGNIAGPQTINLNQPITISSLDIGAANGAGSYTIAANGGSLTFGGNPTLTLTQLSSSPGDILATPIILSNNLLVLNASTHPLTLAGALSSYGGALTLGGGTLQVGAGATNGSLGSVNVIDNGALVFDGSENVTNSGSVSGDGSLTMNGSGTVTLAAVEGYTGATVVNAGTLAVLAPNQAVTGISSSSSLTINSGGAFLVMSDNAGFGTGSAQVPVTINVGGTLTGLATADNGQGASSHLAGLVTLNGGTLTDGGTQINATYGTWDLDGGVAVNSGPNNATTSTIACYDVVPTQTGGTVFNVTPSSPATPSGYDLLVSGCLIHSSGLGDTGIIKTGAGTMVLAGTNTYTGPTIVSNGLLLVMGPNTALTGISTSSNVIIYSNATLMANSDNALFATATSGHTPVTIYAGGTLTGNGAADNGQGPSSHIWGLLTLNGGTLTNGGTSINNVYGSWDLNGGVAVNSGTNHSATSAVACLSVVPAQTGGTIFNVAPGGTPSGIDLLVSGTLIHSSSLGDTGIIKNGLGVMELKNTNTYTGATTINAGTLLVFGSTAGGAVTVAPAGTLGGTGTLGGAVTANGTIAPGTAAAIGTLTCASTVTLSGTTVMKLNKTASANDVLSVGGSLAYGGTLQLTNLSGTLAGTSTFKLFKAASYSGGFTNVTPAIPALNLAWNTNTLTTDGTLRILTAPTAPPRFGNIAANGNGFVCSGSNGVPSWPYYVLASTNLSAPLTSWTVIVTNTFNSAGNFVFTNPLNPNAPETFYVLKLP